MIKFSDLQKQYLQCKADIDEAVMKTLWNGDYILGQNVQQFENNFADYCGTYYCVGVSSGLSALELALRAAGIGEGDEVITVANTFIATALAISSVGAKIVLVDCDYDTQLIDCSQIEKKITKNTKAIIPVNLFGQMVDTEEIQSIADTYGLKVIYDCAQSHGAINHVSGCATFGDMATFSFYPAKNLGCAGDGGAICTNNKEYYEKLMKLRNYGSTKKYYHESVGTNSRLDTIQAGILSVKLRHLDDWNRQRTWLAGRYNEALADVPQIKVAKRIDHNYHVYHLYVVRAEKRDELLTYLSNEGVQCGIHYPVPIHKQDCYLGEDFSYESFPHTEKLADEIISLPMHPYLSLPDISFVVSKIKSFYNG